MKEHLGTPAERNAVAKEILDARHAEKIGAFETNRSGLEYLYRQGGLQHVFKYLKKFEETGYGSNLVLDVGAGNGRAIGEIMHSPMAAGFNFEVTALYNSPELLERFSKEKIHHTPVETLRGVESNSVALVMGVNSVAYSAHPELAVKSIDRVLVPGGIFKGTFCLDGVSVDYEKSTFRDPKEFADGFTKLGYEVSIIPDNKFYNTNKRMFGNAVLLAVKPGNPHAPKAELLMNLDLDEMKNHAKYHRDGLPVFDI